MLIDCETNEKFYGVYDLYIEKNYDSTFVIYIVKFKSRLDNIDYFNYLLRLCHRGIGRSLIYYNEKTDNVHEFFDSFTKLVSIYEEYIEIEIKLYYHKICVSKKSSILPLIRQLKINKLLDENYI
jgi:hypothetical protein